MTLTACEKAAEAALEEWRECRKNTKETLLQLADKIDEHFKNARIAMITGSSAAVVGTALAIGGFVASFFTFGASLVLTGIGAGIGVAGGATGAGATITGGILEKGLCRDAEEALEKDKKASEAALDKLEKLGIAIIHYTKRFIQNHINDEVDKDEEDGAIKAKINDALSDIQKNTNVYNSSGKCVSGAAEAIKFANAMTAASKAAQAAGVASKSAAAGNVFRVIGGTGARALHIGGFVVGVILLPLDLYTIIQGSIDIHTEKKSPSGDKVREMANGLDCPTEKETSKMMDDFITKRIHDMD